MYVAFLLLISLLTLVIPVEAATITVTWTAPTTGGTVAEYRLERKAQACSATGPFASLATVPGTTLVHADATATDGSTYAYRVAAGNATGVGPWSGCKDIIIPVALPVPGAPGTPALQLGQAPPTTALGIGLYYLTQGDLAVAKAKGITHGHIWAFPNGSAKGYLDAAQALGMKVLMEIAFQGGGAASHSEITAYMTPYKDHPALCCWSLTDEPDLAGRDPVVVRNAYLHAKTVDPNHPISIVVTCGDAAKCAPFANAADVVLLDWYPVNYGCPAAAYTAGAMKRGRAAIPLPKPLGGVIQTFNWNQEFGLADTCDPAGSTRVPRWEEVRDMGLSFLKESGNATMLWLYSYTESHHPGQNMQQFNKPTWDNLGTITAAFQAWTPGTTIMATEVVPAKLLPVRTKPLPRSRTGIFSAPSKAQPKPQGKPATKL